ncbi:MAG: DNA polymerase sliding clamp [Candidatus Poseidoniaceae archaeon]|jgi:proliferating cell nuclear antigen
MLNITARQDLMKTIVETLGVVVEEARLDFKENGLFVRVVDPSHVAMIKMEVDSAAFDTWEVDETNLGLEIRKLKDMLSLGATDMVDLTYNDDTGTATVNIGRIDRNIRPLDNSTLNPPNVPDLELPCGVTISGAELAQALRAGRQVGELVTLSLDDKKFSVNVKQIDEVHVEFTKEDLVALDCGQAAKSQYSLSYLIPLSKVFQGIENVNVRFGENFPLKLNFDFADGAGTVEYFLAPRVENDY